MVGLAVYDFCIHSCTVSTSTTCKLLVSFPCPTPPLHSLPLVWFMSYNIAAFILSIQSTYEGEHVAFGFLSLASFT
jgi:hypothetical protein